MIIKEKFSQYLSHKLRKTEPYTKNIIRLISKTDITQYSNPKDYRNGTLFLVDGDVMVMVDKDNNIFYKLSDWYHFATDKDILIKVDGMVFLVINEPIVLDTDKYLFHFIGYLNIYFTELVLNLYKGNINSIPKEYKGNNDCLYEKYYFRNMETEYYFIRDGVFYQSNNMI